MITKEKYNAVCEMVSSITRLYYSLKDIRRKLKLVDENSDESYVNAQIDRLRLAYSIFERSIKKNMLISDYSE